MKMNRLSGAWAVLIFLLWISGGCMADPLAIPSEVRGTWLTTTANDAIATPEKTATTMKRLHDIGLNTVYVECWKNGYTEFPSEVMARRSACR